MVCVGKFTFLRIDKQVKGLINRPIIIMGNVLYIKYCDISMKRSNKKAKCTYSCFCLFFTCSPWSPAFCSPLVHFWKFCTSQCLLITSRLACILFGLLYQFNCCLPSSILSLGKVGPTIVRTGKAIVHFQFDFL